MNKFIRKKHFAILNILNNVNDLLSSPKITELMNIEGLEVSERSVRYYLEELESLGYTEKFGKSGYKLTVQGHNEMDAATVLDKIGFLSSKIDRLSYQMTFDVRYKSGTVVLNTTIVKPKELYSVLPQVVKVFELEFAMGTRTVILEPGHNLTAVEIPNGMIGFGTVCSVTLNGILLKQGIPVSSKFGGLLSIQDGQSIGFTDIIMYNGTSVDPLEIFIRGGMTDYKGAITSGNGKVGASFREFPAECKGKVLEIGKQVSRAGLGYFGKIGSAGRSVFDITVNEGMVGAIVMGGLNPASILEENGIRATSRALSGLIEYDHLIHYSGIKKIVEKYL